MRLIREGLGLSISDVCALTGVARGEISQLERGHLIPRDDQVARLEPVYGPPAGWYPRGLLQALAPDLDECPGCNEELAPDASRRRLYHDRRCARRARRAISNETLWKHYAPATPREPPCSCLRSSERPP